MFAMHRYQGRHRAPSAAGRTATRLVVAGATVAFPVAAASSAGASPVDVVVQCESGGDPKAENPTSTASGTFQFLNGTWAAYGGREFAPRASGASAAEQKVVAERAYAAEGLRPWEASRHCWGGKVGRHESPRAAPKHTRPEQPRHAAPKLSPRSVTSPKPERGDTHLVRRGDTLNRIAAANDATWREVYAANRATVRDPHKIYVGQRLRLP